MTQVKPDRLDMWSIYILKTYNFFREDNNKVDSVQDIPIDVFKMLSAFTYLELITPFVNKDLQKGMKYGQLQTKYRLTENECRSLGRKLGFYTKRTFKNQ